MPFVGDWRFCTNGFWRSVVIDCNVWWPRRVGFYASWPLENDVYRFTGHPAVHSCRWHHGAGENRLTAGPIGGTADWSDQGRSERSVGDCQCNFRFNLGKRSGYVNVYWRHHDAPSETCQLPQWAGWGADC